MALWICCLHEVSKILLGRELKAYEKKIKKARAKLNEDLADRLVKNRPLFSLDHLVKER